MIVRAAILLAAVVLGGLIDSARAEPLRKVLASPLVDEGSDPDGCMPALSGNGGPVTWIVRVERLLLDGKALVETSGGTQDHRYPMCIADQPVAKNLEVELAFVPRQGNIDRVAGIVVRFADPQDYYVVRASALANDVRLDRIVNGVRTALAGRAVPVASDVQHVLKVRVVDDHFAVWFEGKLLLEARDGHLTAPGQIGVWSKSDSVTSFGDLFVTILD
jgi:hypothetical protein